MTFTIVTWSTSTLNWFQAVFLRNRIYCPLILLDSTVVNLYLVECEISKRILTLVTGEPMEGIEEEKHTVVKWNTNTECKQTQASTPKKTKHALDGVLVA